MVNSHTFIDTLQVEKANAIARYQRFRKLAKLLQILQVFLVLTFLSWSSTHIPAAVETVKISGKYVVEVSIYILNPHVVFLIGNAIVIALYLLSRHIDIGNSSDNSDFRDDGYVDENERRLPISGVESIPSAEEMIAVAASVPLAEEMIGEEKKQIVRKENVITETESALVQEMQQPIEKEIQQPIEKETKQIEKFERSMSEKLDRDVSRKPKKELRRSETEVRQVVVTSGRGRMSTFETVDSLSSEDFRLTIEAFIEKQQKFVRQQRVAEIEYC